LDNSEKLINNLLNELKYNPKFNPFHSKFNFEEVLKLIKLFPKGDPVITNENIYIFNLIKILSDLNHISNDSIKHINRCIHEANLELDELQELLVALANHYFLFAQNEANKKYKEAKMTYLEDSLNISSKYAAKIESTLDTNNILFNYFENYYKDIYKTDDIRPKNKDLKAMDKISVYTQILNIYKTFYEKCLYEKFNIKKIERDENLIYLACMVDEEYHIARKISDIRYSKYVFAYLTHLNQSSTRKQMLYETFSNKVKNKKIDKIILENSGIKYTLTDANRDNLDEYFHLLCHLMPFYSFIISNNNTSELILDCLILYSKFQEFFSEVIANTNFTLIETQEDIDKIPFKVNKKILKNYFLETTNIKDEVIDKFLKTLSNKRTINFFKKPLLPKNDYYLFHFLNATANNALNIIDDWLEDNNFKLDGRGVIFEKFIKSELSTIFQEKNYYYHIFDKSKFKSTTNHEEIDLIIVLENIVLLGEAKCIKYPIEIRDTENSCQRILEGVEQIKRKMEFIQNNENIFNINGVNINNKKIIPFVVTNYPCFSGWCPDDIPIIDYELFRNYVDTGALLYGKIDTGVISEEGKKEYYSNQKEFEERFESFLKNPEPIQDISSKLELSCEAPISDASIFMLINPKLLMQEYKFSE